MSKASDRFELFQNTADVIANNEPDTPETSALIVQWRLLAELAALNANLETVVTHLDNIDTRLYRIHERLWETRHGD